MHLTPNQEIIKKDIMRYKNNKLPATLALLGIVFSCLYFCLLYGFRSTFFSNWKIGISVILTLVILLAAFLSSEGIKSYKMKFCIVLIVLAAVQIIRIFILPLSALQHDTGLVDGELALETRYFGIDMSPAACFVMLTVWLCASAGCFIASCVLGYLNCKKLSDYNAQVEKGEIVVEDVLAQLETEEVETAVVNEVETAVANEEVE